MQRSFDLKIVNGTLVDGSGAEPRRADLAIRGGRVVEVIEEPRRLGQRGDAAEVIDAEGAIVTPGFVDVHAHYDGQVSWDPELAPSSLHGVTTCVMGNCGVGFAPVRPTDHETLIDLMQGVEDIPGSVLSEGLRWGWESFPEYLSRIDSFPHAIDFLAQVPHDALRVYVMGQRAVLGEAATEEDTRRMQALLREALQAGAAGFSIGRTDNHRSASGRDTPGAEASAAELRGLAGAFQGLGHGVIQAVSDFDMERDPARFDAEFDLIEGMAEAASGHALSISLMQRDLMVDQWRRIIERAERACARGLPMRLQVAPRAVGVILGLEASFHPFMGFPSYKRVAHLPLAERVAVLRQPEYRARLLKEQSDRLAGDGSAIPPLADRLIAMLHMAALRMFRFGSTTLNYEPRLEDSLAAEASARGVPPLEVLYDALLEDEGRALLYFPLHNYAGFNLDVVGEMLRHPLALPGLGDGGAHAGTICDASFASFLLAHWVRDRDRDRIPLPRAVQMLSADPARYLGLTDRGLLAVGQRADVNVIDLAGLRLLRPRLVADLPAGGRRFLQEAEGYRATVVSGAVIRREGRFTGARPGRLVRMGGAA